MNLNFEKAVTEPELMAIERLAKDIWTEHYTPIIGAEQVSYMLDKYQSLIAMKRQIEQEHYEYYSIKDGSELIGYLAIQARDDRLFLSKLYLDASQRGKGYSKQSQKFMDQLAISRGLKAIRLTVNKYNSNSIKAYKALGFQVIEEAVFDIGEGYVMDDFVMEKTL